MRIGDKMDLRRIVWIAIMFIVGFVYFMIVRFLRLPHLKVFIYALPPHGLFLGIYNTIKGLALQVFGLIFGVFIALTAVNWVLKRIPIFGRLLRRIPPLPQLEQFGIFRLIEGLFGAIFSLMSIKDRLIRVAQVFGTYIATNTLQFMNLLGIQQKLTAIQTNIRNQTDAVKSMATSVTQSPTQSTQSREEMLQRNANAPRPPIFEPSQYRKMDDEYRQCVEENIVSPAPGTSAIELKGIDSRNTVSRIVCKAKYLNSVIAALV